MPKPFHAGTALKQKRRSGWAIVALKEALASIPTTPGRFNTLDSAAPKPAICPAPGSVRRRSAREGA